MFNYVALKHSIEKRKKLEALHPCHNEVMVLTSCVKNNNNVSACQEYYRAVSKCYKSYNQPK